MQLGPPAAVVDPQLIKFAGQPCCCARAGHRPAQLFEWRRARIVYQPAGRVVYQVGDLEQLFPLLWSLQERSDAHQPQMLEGAGHDRGNDLLLVHLASVGPVADLCLVLSVEPWSELPPPFLSEVLQARRRHARLLAARVDELEAWVEQSRPTIVFQRDGCGPYLEPGSSSGNERVQVLYVDVCHNRADIESLRVASLVHALLHGAHVDELANARLMRTSDPSWAVALDRHGYSAHDPLRHSKWLVNTGNHRLLAQHLLGIAPFARADTQPPHWY